VDLGLHDRVVVVGAPRSEDREACHVMLDSEVAACITVESLVDVDEVIRASLNTHGRIDGVVMFLPQTSSSSVLESTTQELGEAWASVEEVAAAFRAATWAMTEQRYGRLISVVTGSVKWLGDEVDELGVIAGLGVLGLHKAAVADVAQFGIAANAVLRDADADAGEVASTVAFLLSASAGYLQGVTISLDGAKSPAVF